MISKIFSSSLRVLMKLTAHYNQMCLFGFCAGAGSGLGESLIFPAGVVPSYAQLRVLTLPLATAW
jgi:hypothetical protein